jgi:hypothetical protein
MATQSENYGLTVGMTADDFVAADDVDRPARTLDRVLGAVAGQLLSAGVYSGWELQTNATVSAGAGLLACAWGQTGTAQAVSGLSNGALNYVFALATSDTPPDGAVAFTAQLNATPPPGALYLGTVTLDGSGNVTALDSQAAGVSRGCFPLLSTTLSGGGTVPGVAGGAVSPLAISHAPLLLPGAISFTASDPHFTFTLEQTWSGAGFTAQVTNTDTVAHDLVYTWQRHGIGG